MQQHSAGIRAIVGITVLAGVLAGGLGRTPAARAAVGSRGDPIFWIGPGATNSTADDKLQVAATLNSTTSVQHISYAVHGPQGTTVHSVQYTGGKLSGRESYTFVADQTLQRYVVVTTVTTQGDVPVTVSQQVNMAGSTSPSPVSITGQSNQDITTTSN